MNLEALLNSVPFLGVCLCWGSFIFSKSLIASLVALLLSSITLPLMFMNFMKVFWPCGLLLILMSTGMIVVFAYIVSLHEGGSKLGMKYSPIVIISLTMILSLFIYKPSLGGQDLLSLKISVDLILSLALIFILLFLVINFVRLVYSKGGGFRKKY